MTKTIEIVTTDGRVRGSGDDALAIFRGVPFAAAPTGTLRFQPPAPVIPHAEMFDATEVAAICPQPPSRLSAVMGDITAHQDESCLTVTIWAPRPLEGKRPILVWFHGGGYTSGGGSLPWYDGERLARENDMVVVNVNYRVGALGYLFKPGLTAGNMGLQDQLQALRWIEKNAASFGGDANRMTLMGQSGGSHSIACMLAMPENRSLVRKAILLSAAFGMRTLTHAEATANADFFLEQLQIDPGKADAMEKLQALSLPRILEAQGSLMRRPTRALGDPTPPFGPTGIGSLSSGAEFDKAVHEGARQIDVIVGATTDESSAFYSLDPRLKGLDAESLPRVAGALFGESGPQRIERARRLRPGATPFELLCEAQTENYFVEGAEAFALATSQGTGNAWLFRFDWSAPSSGFGACHCIELPFVFGTFDAFRTAPMLGGIDAKQEALSAVVRGAFARFVKSGAPDGEDLPPWARFTQTDPAVLVFGSTLRGGRANLRESG